MTDTTKPAGGTLRPAVITLRPSTNNSLKEITLIGPPRNGGRPREITLVAPSNKYHLRVFEPRPCVEPLSYPLHSGAPLPDSALLLNSKKIPRPPNAFMIFANEWRKQLAQQHPTDSNKSISVRLGQLWKNMSKGSKEIYYQRSRQAGQDHKQKYPGYVYNPKEARMRKALREQSRGTRVAGGAPTRWTKHALTMNHHRQPLVTPVLLSQHQHCADSSKGMLDEQVDRDNSMLQSYPDYLDLPYNIPSNDYPLDNQPWYPSYLQPGVQSEGSYMGRTNENKLPVDWSTPYSSEQGNFIRASPQSSPYSIQNHQEVVQNNLLLNGDRSQPEQTANCETSCLAADHKPVVDTNSDSNPIKDPEQQVKELLASAKVISEGSPVEDLSSTRLPGFHQAFGSTEIGRFSQPDGFFEAAVAAENERKVSMSPLPPPPPKRGRAPRGGRKAKSRAEPEKWPDPCLPMGNAMVKKDSWQDWNPGLQPGCDNAMNSLQRMNCYPYHEDQRPPVNCPHPDMYQYPQWHSEMPYYERQNCNQYYPPYYNPPQEQMRSYHDCYTPYDYPPPSWRGHPYYHPSHFPHHQNVGYYQQYSEYRHYGYQNNRWAVNREIKYSSGMV
ncbi:uncharacterized protein LOC124357378 isoform X1 [Homalodisca vitripennis]|uniref:uncharacterized protein LOC124357378 isoform X1 n=2 Tax=Homalodisca vitripennis TaxID=197043 RepID=UPI001EEAA01D|nr:uncharacterized protein LOC124357378 isoform X1 [Homalodisca vitripennis]